MNAVEDKLITRLFKDTLTVVMLSMIASTIGNVIDGIITGSFLGTDAMAAFGFTVPYQRFVTIFPLVLALGMQILCSKALGRGDLREANGNFSLAVTAALALMIFLTGATFLFTGQLADILGAGENLGQIRSLTVDYLQAFSLSLPAMALVSVLMPIMQLDNERNRAVFATAVLSVSNIVADLVSVFVCDGGLWGIGLATAVSYWIAAGVLLLHFVKPNASFAYLPKAMHVKNLREMFLSGVTMIVGRGTSVLTVSILTRISLATAGGAGVAAFAAVWNFMIFIELIPKALGSSTQIISGLLIGERDKPSLVRLIKISLKYSLAISAIMTPIIFLAAPTIADLYVPDADAAAYQMTLEGVRLCSLSMLPCAVSLLSNYYCVAAGQFRFATVTTILNNIGIMPFALILTPHFGITGLWLAFPLRYVALVLLAVAVTCHHCRRITFRLEDYLLLPEDFDVAEDKQLNMTVTNKAEVVGLSERTQTFCTVNGIDNRRSMFAGICIEEIAGNIVDYGFGDGKKHFVDVRIIVNGEQIIIRLRDDCRPFDPKKWYEIYNPDDPTAHIGIRLVRKIATEFDYVNALKLNNLIIKF